MDENQFWATCWKTGGAVVAMMVLTAGGCTMYRHAQVTAMVAAGADPIKAQCAVGPSNTAVCAVAAMK